MSQFVKKASSKIEKLSTEEIVRIIEAQNYELKVRNAVLDNSFQGYLLVDSNGTIIYMNENLGGLVPVAARKKYSGVNVSRAISNAEILEYINGFIASDKETATEFFDVDVGMDEPKSISCYASRVSDPQCFSFLFRDLTFFNRFKDEFRRNESLAQMTTMAASVAHEIKNPLASISIYLQLMEKMMEKNGMMTLEDSKQYLDIINEEVERINKIAVDFLFAVKPMKVSLNICNINDIVKKTAKVVEGELQAKGIEFKMNLATSLPKVFADSSLMEQSILNLVKNAMQAMPKDRENPSISISTYMDSDMVKLSVADNGCGMTEDTMSKIFEPYYTTKSSGTGLGLTVLFKIMKQHGGEVKVHSTYGEGSEFTLQIPVPQTERFRLTDGRQ